MQLNKIKNFVKFYDRKNYKFFFFFLIIFSIYCSLNLGKVWDEGAHLKIGKITLDYLFSVGEINKNTFLREHFSAMYWSLKYLLTQIFPSKYQIEANHLVNLTLSISAVIAFGQLNKQLFNKNVGRIIFLILFSYPVFFGHMSFNSKDIILAFSHVWIFYLVIRYLKKQSINEKRNNYVISIGIIAAMATGIELVFLGTLIPVFVFIFIEIFVFKKLICKNFNKKKFYIDLLKVFLIFYFLLILFWIDTHPNIIVLPFNFFLEHLSLASVDLKTGHYRGWPFNLINGEYYLSWQVTKLHFLINLIYKSPEYFLISYLIFFATFITSKNFYVTKFKFFKYKLVLLLSIILLSILVSFFLQTNVYDGMRHSLWSIPYFCIIPGLAIYYLIENFNLLKSKLTSAVLAFFIIYFAYNFFLLTPYHYTYLNSLNGKVENRYQKFENDYWGSSLKELIKKSKFENTKDAKIATCGVSSSISKKYLKEKGFSNLVFFLPREANFIIMTNRTLKVSGELTERSTNKNVKIINCFDRYKGEDLFVVKRNGMILSVIRGKTESSYWN